MGGGIALGVTLLASTAAAETVAATTAAVGTAVASSSKRKEEEPEEKPQEFQEAASSPPPPSSTPIIGYELPKERPPIEKEPSSPSPSQEEFQRQAQLQADYLYHFASHPHTPLSRPAPTASSEPPPSEEPFYTSVLQTIRSGLSLMGKNAIDNPDLFQPNSPADPFHNAYADLQTQYDISRHIEFTSPTPNKLFFSIAPLKSVYHDFLNLLASAKISTFGVLGDPQHSIYQTIKGDPQEGMQVSYINGMNNFFMEFIGNAKHLKSFTSLPIDGIYNCTHTIIIDPVEVLVLNLAGYSPITQELLMKKFTRFAEANQDNPHAKCMHYCHSQGALHTRNALKKLPPHIRDRVIVVCIAGACVVPDRLCFKSFNYVSERDYIHLPQRCYASLFLAHLSEEEQKEMLDQEIADSKEIIVLKAHEGATGLDHAFQSPTFVEKIKDHLTDYQIHKGQY